MAEITSCFENNLPQIFKYINQLMMLMWRLGLGSWVNSWPEVFGRIMVVTHKGRKTGFRRHTPVNYAIVDGEIYCVAGFGKLSDWYRNIMINHDVEVWLPNGITKADSWWSGVAEDISESESRLSIIRNVMISSGFVGRLMDVNPFTISDAELDDITSEYRVIHITRIDARTGSGGPGELSWVWPMLSSVLLFFIVFKPKRRSR